MNKYHSYRYDSSDDEVTVDKKELELVEKVEKKSEKVEKKSEKVEKKSEKVEKKSEKVEKKSEKVEKKPEKVEKKPEKVEKKPEKVEKKNEVNNDDYEEDDTETETETEPCVDSSMRFIRVIRNVIDNEDTHDLSETLSKTPLPVLLHYIHYLFYILRNKPDMTKVIAKYNYKYNIVSKYFTKAIKSEDKAVKAMKMLINVTEEMIKDDPPSHITNLKKFTPEFQMMVYIQNGYIDRMDSVFSEWEVSDNFIDSIPQIAAFFGIDKYFSSKDDIPERRDIFVSAICGGSIKTLSKIVEKTSTRYLTDYTLMKSRSVVFPGMEMLKHLLDKYELELS